jgi:hypothetical protein
MKFFTSGEKGGKSGKLATHFRTVAKFTVTTIFPCLASAAGLLIGIARQCRCVLSSLSHRPVYYTRTKLGETYVKVQY